MWRGKACLGYFDVGKAKFEGCHLQSDDEDIELRELCVLIDGLSYLRKIELRPVYALYFASKVLGFLHPPTAVVPLYSMPKGYQTNSKSINTDTILESFILLS